MQDYIIIDTETRSRPLEELTFGYIELARNTGYKDVRVVLPRGLLAESNNYALDEAILTQRHTLHGTGRDEFILDHRDKILIPDANYADIRFISEIAAAFSVYLEPGMVSDADKQRVQSMAWELKKKLSPETCPAHESDINIYDFKDQFVVSALYGISATRKYIMPHIRMITHNSGDHSIIAWYKDMLERTHGKLRNEVIYVGKDRMILREMGGIASKHGCRQHFHPCRRDEFIDYIQAELQAIRRYVDHHQSLDGEYAFRIDELIRKAGKLSRSASVRESAL